MGKLKLNIQIYLSTRFSFHCRMLNYSRRNFRRLIYLWLIRLQLGAGKQPARLCNESLSGNFNENTLRISGLIVDSLEKEIAHHQD